MRQAIEDRVIEKLYFRQRFLWLIDQLTVKQLLWLWLYLNGYDHNQIAEILDFSRQRSYEMQKMISKRARSDEF